MSTSVMALCWPLQMPPSAKAVLVSLADNANDQGVCWPSIPTIMERTCLSERTVQAQLAWLEENKAIRREFRNGSSTMYVVVPSQYQPPQMPHPRNARTPAADAPPPPQMPHPTPANAAPRTVSEPSVEPPKAEVAQKRTHRNDGGTRLPDDWVCPDDWADEAIKIQSSWTRAKAFLVADAFRDYWVSVPGAKGKKADWLATWRNWVRREKPMQYGPPGNHRKTVADEREAVSIALTGRKPTNDSPIANERDITGHAIRIA